MYRLSAKQLIFLTVLTAILSALVVVFTQKALVKSGGSISLEPVAIADPSVASEEQNNIDIYRAVSPGVVNITSSGYSRNFWGYFPSQGTGSGSILDLEGHILTNYHVIQNASKLEVQIENDKYPARVIGIDRDNDLAVIKVDAPRNKLTVVRLGTSTGLQVGQKVLAIGNPFGLQRTMTTGIISGLERPLHDPVAGRTIDGAIQTDASINPGNSGGPLLNSHGEMIGINTAIFSPTGGEGSGSIGIGFAVPVDLAKRTIPDLISKGYVARPWLGFSTTPLNASIASAFDLSIDRGLMVNQVYRGTNAASAGLHGLVVSESFWGNQTVQQLGDIILSIDGKPVASVDDQNRVLDGKSPGQTIELGVMRNGRKYTIPLKLSERPRDVQ
ncbi:MAG TPA: trypsin-like peptidase domain-containing protein [Blastocatellia bacterium]